jgi:tetratricopeptide (TPR) repeat protein
VGIVAMGLLVGPATAAGSPRPRSAVRLRTGFVVLALALVVAQGIALLARTDIENSRAAASRGDDRVALDRAEGARRWQPWASSPYLQIALVQEQLINFDAARDAVRQAIDRDERNWRLWYVAARIDREAGHAAAARASLKRAEQLNPRSALFSKRRGS